MKKNTVAEILKLPVSQRILLVEDIWDSIVEVPQEVSLTDQQCQELDKRLEAYRQNPQKGSPWNKVKARIKKE